MGWDKDHENEKAGMGGGQHMALWQAGTLAASLLASRQRGGEAADSEADKQHRQQKMWMNTVLDSGWRGGGFQILKPFARMSATTFSM